MIMPREPGRNNSPWWLEWLFVLAVIAIFLWAAGVIAAPIAEAVAGDGSVKVILTDEPCALSAIVNLGKRVTWAERGGVIEGCYGIGNGLVLCYFADRTVVAIPSSVFNRVSGT